MEATLSAIVEIIFPLGFIKITRFQTELQCPLRFDSVNLYTGRHDPWNRSRAHRR